LLAGVTNWGEAALLRIEYGISYDFLNNHMTQIYKNYQFAKIF